MRGQVLKQEDHPALNGLGGDDVVVIQHERDVEPTRSGQMRPIDDVAFDILDPIIGIDAERKSLEEIAEPLSVDE